MKKFIIFSFSIIIIAAACLSLHWRQVKIAKFDSDFRQSLAGTWSLEEDDLPRGVAMPLSMRCTNIVAADGSYAELSWFSHTDRTNTYQRTGTWIVKNGHLIQTLKTSSNPSEKTPWTSMGRIIQVNTHGFTVRWPKADVTWQKVQ